MSPPRFATTPELRVQGIAEQVFSTEPLRPVHSFPIAELAITSKPEANEPRCSLSQLIIEEEVRGHDIVITQVRIMLKVRRSGT